MTTGKKLILLLLGAFLIRFLLIPVAHHGDLNNNISWGNELLTRGTVNFFEGQDWPFSAPNQPPLYILLFGITSFIYKSLSNLFFSLNNSLSVFPSSLIWYWESSGMDLIVKLPGILADLGIAYLIYKFFKDRKKVSLGLNLAAVWLFNPITIYSSSIWGQTDSFVNLLGLLSIFFLLNKKITGALIFITLSLLFKGSLTIFLPIILFILILQKHQIKKWLKAIVFSFIAVILISVWFHPQLDLPIWLFNLYTNRFFPGEIGDLTANAFNFWWLVDSGKTLDSKLLFGLEARIIGYAITLIGLVFILLKLKKDHSEKKILYSFTLISLVSFLFMTRIHERYLYPFFPIATILLGFIPSSVIPYLVLSVVHLLNLYHLFWAPGIPALESIYQNPSLMQILSIINLIIFGYFFYKFASVKEKS